MFLRVLRPSVVLGCWRKSTFSNASSISPLSTLVMSPKQLTKDDDLNYWVKSPFPNIDLVTDLTIHEQIWSRLGIGKDREKCIALECGISGRKYTFGEVYKKSRAFAAALMHAGFKKGDVLGIVLPNIPEYGIALLGALEAGLTISPVNPAYTSEEIKRQLEIADVKCVVTIPHFLSSTIHAKSSLPLLEKVILIGENHEGCHSFTEMMKTDTTGVEFFSGNKNIDPIDDVALLPFSSGTTGLPKGVQTTHFNTTNVTQAYLHPDVCAFNEYDGSHEQERLIGLLPFFHSYGMSAILLLGLYNGSYTLCLPKFEHDTFLKAIRQHKPTSIHLVTPLISHLVNSTDFGKNELKDVHTIMGAAAPIGATLINRLLEKAERYIFFQEGYGMTELSPVSHCGNPSAKNTKVGSCGRPIPNTLTKIVDPETGKTIPPGNRGELCVKGPQIMKGYYKNEEATKNTVDKDGWLHTGDIAFYDEDGFCYIVDRLKELIKVKGYQVAPSELEDILRKHPKIEDVAVIGVPHEECGEAPRAYIVRSDSKLDNCEVNEYLEEKVVSFKKLRGGIEFVETIPKAPSGKILRRIILESYREKEKEGNL